MYDRPAPVATKFNTWNINKDMSTGVVGIPILMNRDNPLVTPAIQSLVQQAAAIVSQTSCVKFSPVDSVSPTDRYVNLAVELDGNGNPNGCMAQPPGLPEEPSSPTTLSVGGCQGNAKPLGSLVHELLHVLSVVHTQMRTDRDDYIRMNPSIVRHFFEENFFLTPYAFDGADGNYSPYDYGSIMHYTRTQAADVNAYRANPELGGTFTVLKPLANGVTLGQRNAMSALDIAEINTVYQCNGVVAADQSTYRSQTTTPTPLGGTLPPRPTMDPSWNPAALTSSTTTVSPRTSTWTTTPTPGPAVPVVTTTTPTPTATPPSVPWSGWDDDIKKIADSIDHILDNENIYLGDKQLDYLDQMLQDQKNIFQIFSDAVQKNTLRIGWRDMITDFASNVFKLINESRKGIAAFDAGKNPDQESIMDMQSIIEMEKIIMNAKMLYAKLDEFSKTLTGAVSLHEQVDAKHPSPIGPIRMRWHH